MTAAPHQSVEASAIREDTISLLGELLDRSKEYQLEPPPTLDQFRRKLQQNTYNIVVVGEAKRGKSTFVNALIGREILPTDVDVATSQVFRVARSDREGYRVRFADGRADEITAAELPQYGSQVEVDRRAGVPLRAGEIVQWIEVDVPARFLPQDVSIVDTPGLGSLHEAHAVITRGIVPLADAVIFVLDSDRPIGQEELVFVDELLKQTPRLFFIQTKIDRYPEEWEVVLRRNQEILRQRFQGRLQDPRVWPIASSRLLRAARTESEDTRLRSRHQELAVALRDFLFDASGWALCGEAVVAAEAHHGRGRMILQGRLDSLKQETEKEREEARRRAAELQRQFEADWGPRGTKRDELTRGIAKSIGLNKRRFDHALHPKGRLFTELADRINTVQTVEEANRVALSLPDDVAVTVSEAWQRVCDRVWQECDELVRPFAQASQEIGIPRDAPELDLREQFDTLQDSFMATLVHTRGQTITVTWLSGVGLGTLAGLGIIAPPVSAVLGATIAVTALARSWGGAKETQLKIAKQEVLKYLNDLRQQAYHHFFSVDLETSEASLVDEYFSQVERAMNEQIQSIVKQKIEEAKNEATRLARIQESEQERNAWVKQIAEQIKEWNGLAGRMQRVKDAIRRSPGFQTAARQSPQPPGVPVAT